MQNKTWIVLQREYLTRVKKKSFIILTFLMPILFSSFIFIPILLDKIDTPEVNTIAVVDKSELFMNAFKETESLKYKYIDPVEFDEVKQKMKEKNFYALLMIPQNIYASNKAILYSDRQITMGTESTIRRQLENLMEKDKRAQLIKELKVPDLEQRLRNTNTSIKINSVKISEDGKAKKSSAGLASAIGGVTGFLIYIFLIMFGQMVMASIMEEKTNRIVEVIVSSVKPFQLLVGKIVGVALVGLTQIVMWVVLSVILLFVAKSYFLGGQIDAAQAQDLMAQSAGVDMAQVQQMGGEKAQEIFEIINGIDFVSIIGFFAFFFIGGYLLYSSFFGAIGAAVDAQEDAQQFMLPIMLPIIISFMMMMIVVKNPDGALAFWGSMIPFTSPIVMMARVPYGVPAWEMALSMSLLIASIIGAIWMASKIYRTGILMYGKKVSWKELFKWLRYKNY
ncbi:ABC transporter permease [Prolixibacteraceae bacterium JC049]|nr:ABC transporter permease [Prolixibacteraceae bacterium JC049]